MATPHHAPTRFVEEVLHRAQYAELAAAELTHGTNKRATTTPAKAIQRLRNHLPRPHHNPVPGEQINRRNGLHPGSPVMRDGTPERDFQST